MIFRQIITNHLEIPSTENESENIIPKWTHLPYVIWLKYRYTTKVLQKLVYFISYLTITGKTYCTKLQNQVNCLNQSNKRPWHDCGSCAKSNSFDIFKSTLIFHSSLSNHFRLFFRCSVSLKSGIFSKKIVSKLDSKLRWQYCCKPHSWSHFVVPLGSKGRQNGQSEGNNLERIVTFIHCI